MYPPNFMKHNSYGSIKKIKNYSYNPLDSIGKGFSSVVYRGMNDDTSKKLINKCIFLKQKCINSSQFHIANLSQNKT